MAQTKSPYQCRRCEVFTSPLIERGKLERLLKRDLKYYLKTRHINYPLAATNEDLTVLILGHQAQVLAERAKKALEQLSDDSEVGSEELDPSRLMPHTSAYSTSQTGLTGQSSVSKYSGAQIRAEVRRKTDLQQVSNTNRHTMQELLARAIDGYSKTLFGTFQSHFWCS